MPSNDPKTIEQLDAWYKAHNLPPEEVTRFFIGKDVQEPRAFGIYRDGDRYVVYKNKASGARAVRYHGPDEAYAVKELLDRLKQEIASQKAYNAQATSVESAEQRRSNMIANAIAAIVVAVTLVVTGVMLWRAINSPDRGYYNYHDNWYYYQDESWYTYGDDWYPVAAEEELDGHWNDYYQGKDCPAGDAITSFESSDYYHESSSSSDDYSWSSSDSWDSDSTDWSSGW